MLTARDFRRITLGLKGASEGAHMGHPDFRVGGRIFATLNAEETIGVVMLTPEQQQGFIDAHPTMFRTAAGAWGRGGSTHVHLDTAEEDVVGEAVTLAWRNKKTASTRTAATKKAATARRTASNAKRSGRSKRLSSATSSRNTARPR